MWTPVTISFDITRSAFLLFVIDDTLQYPHFAIGDFVSDAGDFDIAGLYLFRKDC